jgi:hypothetical protein
MGCSSSHPPPPLVKSSSDSPQPLESPVPPEKPPQPGGGILLPTACTTTPPSLLLHDDLPTLAYLSSSLLTRIASFLALPDLSSGLLLVCKSIARPLLDSEDLWACYLTRHAPIPPLPDHLLETFPKLAALHDVASTAEWVEIDFPVNDAFVSNLCQVLPRNSVLHTLQFSQGGLTANSLLELQQAITQQNHITFLEINNSPGLDFAPLFSCPSLKALSLSKNEINSQQLLLLAAALKTNCTLDGLYLRENAIGDEGVKALVLVLENNNKTLTSLDLAENQIGDDGALALQLVYKKHKTLTKLNVEENFISPHLLKELGRGYVQPTVYSREKSKEFTD